MAVTGFVNLSDRGLMRRQKATVVPIVFLLALSGCSGVLFKSAFRGRASTSSISGSVRPLSASQVASLSASGGCTDPVAYACRVEDLEDCRGQALSQTPVAHDGSYSLQITQLGGPFSSQEVKYAVVVEGCAETYSRPITGTDNQDLDLATTLVSYVQSSGATRKFQQVAPSDLDRFLKTALSQLSGSAMSDLYVSLRANSALAANFQTLFGVSPTQLEQAAPNILSLTRPASSLSEGQTISLAVSTSHWNPSYDTVYLWKLDDNTVLGSATTLNHVLGANMQGERTITLYIGSDDGTGHLDTLKPVTSVPMSFTVANTILPQAPVLTLASPTRSSASDPVGTRSLILSVATGALKANCASFSTMALSEDASRAPDPADFTLSCTSAGTQSVSHTLQSGGDGSKTLALWARDRSGQIGATPSTISIVLDTTSPSVTISSAPAAFVASTSVSVAFAATDSGSVSAYECRLDSGSWSACSSPKTFSGLSAGAHTVSVRASDTAGNVATPAVASFSVDTSAPTVTITSAPAALVATRTVSFSFAGDDGTSGSGVESFECSLDTGAWTVCSSPASHAGLVDGTHTFRVRAIDGAGNFSTSPPSASFKVDATAPTLAISALPGPYTGGTGNNAASALNLQWTATEANADTSLAFTLEYSTDDGSTWNAIGTKAATNGPLTSQAYSYSWTVPASLDAAQARVRVGFTDLVGNSAVPATSAAFKIDSTKPSVSSLTLAGGSSTTAMPTVSVALSSSDGSASASSGVTSMQISESSSFASASWQNFATNAYLTLSQTNGMKTVYARVRDAAGNVSDSVQTQIELDFGSPPLVGISSPIAGATYNPGDVVPIAWSCAPTGTATLDATPIPFIRYTIDEGTTFFDITSSRTNNDSSTTGSYAWTLPATAPTSPTATSMRANLSAFSWAASRPAASSAPHTRSRSPRADGRFSWAIRRRPPLT